MSRTGSAAERYARHLQAVARSLAHADAAAERGDYADALAWVRTVLALGEDLPDEYERKRHAWQRALLEGYDQGLAI